MRKIVFSGQSNKYSSLEFAKKKKKKNAVKGTAYLGASGIIGQQTIRSGIPRLLGVRLESHSTSKRNAKEILKNGGILDPNRGGTGASKAVNDVEYINKSKSFIHITGKHKDHQLESGRVIHKDMQGKVISNVPTYEKVKNNLFRDIAWRKTQRGMYRGITGETLNMESAKGITKAISNIGAGMTGLKGKTLYIGGSDDYFNKNFTPDGDDLGLKSTNKIKVHNNRASATLDALKKEGSGSRLKGIAKLVKANPTRSLTGAGIVLGGGLVTAKLGQSAYRNLITDGKVKGHTRKNKSGKWSNIKSFIRGKINK